MNTFVNPCVLASGYSAQQRSPITENNRLAKEAVLKQTFHRDVNSKAVTSG